MDRFYLALAAAVAAVLIGAGAEPPMPASSATPESDRLFSTSLQTPRFYSMETRTVLGGRTMTKLERICIGGAPARGFTEGIERLAHDPEAYAQFAKGCSSRSTRKGGEISRETTCDEAKGAVSTTRSKLTGTPDNLQDHLEVTVKGVGRLVKDRHMIYLGDCPANVKAGQVLELDGTVMDPLAPDPRGEARGPRPG